jgi:hypothetical protein
MIKTVIIFAVLAFAFAEEAASTNETGETGGTKETIGKGYGNVYGGNGYAPPPPAYGPPPPAYGPPPPAYGPPLPPPVFSPPRDTHYCSVHASFALALASQQQPASAPYGGNAGPKPPRRFTRQFCRYTAASTPESCNYCCAVAARAANTSPDEIFGAVFSFDPQNPSSNGAGFDDSQDGGYNNGPGPYRKKRHAPVAADARIPQCVCCAPKRPFF